jgi:hypothetical protein
MLNRRIFLGTGISASVLLAAPTVWGQAKPKVVVIGGAPGVPRPRATLQRTVTARWT